jgi:hypothetical protein
MSPLGCLCTCACCLLRAVGLGASPLLVSPTSQAEKFVEECRVVLEGVTDGLKVDMARVMRERRVITARRLVELVNAEARSSRNVRCGWSAAGGGTQGAGMSWGGSAHRAPCVAVGVRRGDVKGGGSAQHAPCVVVRVRGGRGPEGGWGGGGCMRRPLRVRCLLPVASSSRWRGGGARGRGSITKPVWPHPLAVLSECNAPCCAPARLWPLPVWCVPRGSMPRRGQR